MLPIVLAIAPGLATIIYIYYKDSSASKKYLLVCFFWGMLSTVPAIVIQLSAKALLGDISGDASIFYYAFYAFIIVACSEEGSKFAVVKWYAYPKKVFDEPANGIIYSVMVAMGFATVENIGYVQQHGIGTAVLRMLVSVPAHAAFGTIMGYYTGLAKLNKEKSILYFIKGLSGAVFFHGVFDFFLFLQDNNKVKEYAGEGLLLAGAMASYYVAIRLRLRSIRLYRERWR
jgi:protease PrsW